MKNCLRERLRLTLAMDLIFANVLLFHKYDLSLLDNFFLAWFTTDGCVNMNLSSIIDLPRFDVFWWRKANMGITKRWHLRLPSAYDVIFEILFYGSRDSSYLINIHVVLRGVLQVFAVLKFIYGLESLIILRLKIETTTSITFLI